MSSLEQAIKVTVGVTAAVALGTAYVLVHERRRKAKAVRKAAEAAAGGSGGGDSSQSTVLSATRLIDLLAESAKAAYQLIEQTRKMVHEKHVATGMALETCVDELQKDFESAMEAVMGSIRAKHGVTEQVMSMAMMQHQSVPEVAAAVTALREAMGGKAPPGYAAASAAAEAEAAKQRVRRKNKTGRKG